MWPGPGCAGASVPVVTGASVSFVFATIENATDFVASTLPALSVERYSTVYAPGAVNEGRFAASYVIHSAAAIRGAANPLNAPEALTWYSVSATPDVASAADSDSRTGPVYGPEAGSSAAVLAGAVASSLTVTDFVASVLPALSTERYSTVWVPSPGTLNGAL